jgi:hypothetical protein
MVAVGVISTSWNFGLIALLEREQKCILDALVRKVMT